MNASTPRRVNDKIVVPRECGHQWQPAGMVFETQSLGEHGQVNVRQPDIHTGRVYLVCLLCASHTYMETSWAGFRLYGSSDTKDLP